MRGGTELNRPEREQEEHRSILEAWRRLSSAETEAMEAGDWVHLARVQDAKATLQDRLSRSEYVPDRNDNDPGLGSLMSEILERERSNLRLLDRRKDEAKVEQAAVECSRRNLRRQQKLFVGRTATSWQCYS